MLLLRTFHHFLFTSVGRAGCTGIVREELCFGERKERDQKLRESRIGTDIDFNVLVIRRVRATPSAESSFANRKALPEAWRGIRDAELSDLTGIPGCIFVRESLSSGCLSPRERGWTPRGGRQYTSNNVSSLMPLCVQMLRDSLGGMRPLRAPSPWLSRPWILTRVEDVESLLAFSSHQQGCVLSSPLHE